MALAFSPAFKIWSGFLADTVLATQLNLGHEIYQQIDEGDSEL